MDVAERLRTELSQLRVESDQGAIQFTVSICVAMLEEDVDTLATMMSRSDYALYKAKEAGRNCVVCW